MKLISIPLVKGRVAFMAATETTQEQWKAVMGANPSSAVLEGHPVEYVSWLDAKEFCAKLSKKENVIYRLPTTVEWKAAASEGLPADIQDYDIIKRWGWYLGEGDHGTHKVAKKAPNPLGFYDLFGNVEEWCADKNVRGGSFLHSAKGCVSRQKSVRHETLKANDLGFRVVMERQHSPQKGDRSGRV